MEIATHYKIVPISIPNKKKQKKLARAFPNSTVASPPRESGTSRQEGREGIPEGSSGLAEEAAETAAAATRVTAVDVEKKFNIEKSEIVGSWTGVEGSE